MKQTILIFALSVFIFSCRNNNFKHKKPVVSYPQLTYNVDTSIYLTIGTKIIKDTLMWVKTGDHAAEEKWTRDTFYMVNHFDSTGKILPMYCPKQNIQTEAPVGIDSVLRRNKHYTLEIFDSYFDSTTGSLRVKDFKKPVSPQSNTAKK